ncbi:Aste57867_12279 [Aphanomyces stellatus]|uniref:RING-type E3 ubiquitin transferase n=1 Tax=Aphanomyces stellatus TaxID=120398 RepID=A0A485KX59_9STRA|nr:hypothetical protein As57867_012234 [Aphanomyces stellatus]VFT89132.1 Aste57867_12279 [Aphanomyces stellatus]
MSSDVAAPAVLPTRFQCPLCLDLLTSPVQLPCCRKHLCLVCFERAVQLTSTNCAFCRKRIVGFARRQSKKIDEALWVEIQSQTHGMDTFMFDDDGGTTNAAMHLHDAAAPGELQSYYEERVAAAERERAAREEEALAATMRLLEAEQLHAPSTPGHTADGERATRPSSTSDESKRRSADRVFAIFASAKPLQRNHASVAPKSRKPMKLASSSSSSTKKSWACPGCTYLNWSHQMHCVMCRTRRGPTR